MDELGYMSRGSSGTNTLQAEQRAQHSHGGMREHGILKTAGVQSGWGIRSKVGSGEV